MKALSPLSSSLFPCLKLRPEKPKLNLNPGIFCASLSCTESISYKSVTAKGRLSFKLFFLSFNSSRGHYVTANNCLRTKVHSCATQKKKLLRMGSLVFVGQDDAKNRCPESLCPFPLQFLEWRIQIDWENNNWTRSLNIAIYQRLADHTTHSQIKIFFSETIPFLRRSILGGPWFSLCSTTLLPCNWTTAYIKMYSARLSK